MMKLQIIVILALSCVGLIFSADCQVSYASATRKKSQQQQRQQQRQERFKTDEQLLAASSYYFEPDKLLSITPDEQQQQQRIFREAASAAAASGNSTARARRHIRVVTIEIPPFMMIRHKKYSATDAVPSTTTTRSAQDAAPAATGDDAPPPSNGMSDDDFLVSEQPGGSRIEWYGYCVDFFREVIKHLPYEVTYEIYQVPDNKFGSRRARRNSGGASDSASSSGSSSSGGNSSKQASNFQWNGMVGELASKRAHLALAPLAVMAERELVIDFTVPFYDLVGIQILLKRPEVPQDWFKFLTVLDGEVWLSITLAYFVTSFIIYLFDRLSPYSHKNQVRIKRMREHQRASRQARKAAGGGGGDSMRALDSLPPLPPPPSFISLPLDGGGGGGLGESKDAPVTRAPTRPPLMLAYGGLRGGASRIEPLFAETLPPPPPPGNAELHETGGMRGSQRRKSSAFSMRMLAANGVRAERLKPPQDGASGNEDDDSDDEEDDGKPDFNLRDSLWFCITSLTPQGGGEAPQNLSGRVVAGAWWLFCFIVIASYTANLAAFLTVSRLDIPIESLDDLAKQYRIKYAPIDGTAEQNYFERMAYIEEIFYNIWKDMSLNDSLSEEERSKFSIWDYPISDKYTKIWAQIQEVSMPSSLSEALERVRASSLDDGFALLANANMIRYATMTDCQLKAVGEEFSRKPIALGLAKGEDALRDDISYAILQLINRRFMEVLREKWWTNNPMRVVCETNDEAEGISVENIGGVFIIILAGVALSFFVWAIERLVYRTKLEVSRELLLEMTTSNNSPAGPSAGAAGATSGEIETSTADLKGARARERLTANGSVQPQAGRSSSVISDARRTQRRPTDN